MSSTTNKSLRRNNRPSIRGIVTQKAKDSLEHLKSRQSRRRKRKHKHEPFIFTVCKVGTSLLLLFGLCSFLYDMMTFKSMHNDGQSRIRIPHLRNHHRSKQRKRLHHDFVNNREKYVILPSNDNNDDDENDDDKEDSLSSASVAIPYFPLDTENTDIDVFGIASMYLSTAKNTSIKKKKKKDTSTKFIHSADAIRGMFAQRYGGENAARAILDKGLTIVEKNKKQKKNKVSNKKEGEEEDNNDSISNKNNNDENVRFKRLGQIAERIRMARSEESSHAPTKKSSFRMAFVGTSATAGYGNDFSQSYPLVVEEILREPFQHLGLDFKVTNTAMDGLSSFPFGWCMKNFFSFDGTTTSNKETDDAAVDIISWDFGAVSDTTLEAFIRQVTTINNNMERQQQRPPPMMIFRDVPGRDVIQKYVDADILTDSLLVHTNTPMNALFSDMKEKHLPIGFQGWKDFGAPNGAPGIDDAHNLSVKQHELTAWLIAMDLLSAMELLVADDILVADSGASLLNIMDDTTTTTGRHDHQQEAVTSIPPPFSKSALKEESKDWYPYLFGSPIQPSIQCRTSFESHRGGGNDLKEIIISGTVGDDIDLLLPKGPMYYNDGWIMDLDKDEKQQRKRLQQWDFLGFKDIKKALYGVPASGPLQLFLPISTLALLDNKTAENNRKKDKKNQRGLRFRENHNDQRHLTKNEGEEAGLNVDDFGVDAADDVMAAKHYIQSVIVCESNVPRLPEGCNIKSDVAFTIGGILVSDVQLIQSDVVSSFGKQLCTILKVPNDAQLTTQSELLALHQKKTERTLIKRTNSDKSSLKLGLPVQIEVTNRSIHWAKGPCSIAHVLWEEKL